MPRSAKLVFLGVFVFALVVSIVMVRRIDAPRERAWWAGKNPVIRVQVWEAEKDMPTFSMTVPKRTLDRMVALGLPPTISINGDREVSFRRFWHDLQRLPRGGKIRFMEGGDSVVIWIEAGKGNSPADSTL